MDNVNPLFQDIIKSHFGIEPQDEQKEGDNERRE